MFLCWQLSDDKSKVMGLGKKAIEVKYSHHILSRVYTIKMISLLMLTLITEVVSVSYLNSKIRISFFPKSSTLCSLEGSHYI